MIATVGIVVVIYPGFRQPRKFYKMIIFCRLSLKIALKWLRSVTPAGLHLENVLTSNPSPSSHYCQSLHQVGGGLCGFQPNFDWGESTHHHGHILLY
jgi:hypothetical protein